MKQTLIFLFFALFSTLGYAQTGSLEPIYPGDTLLVMRTSPDVLTKLQSDSDSKIRHRAGIVESVERGLNNERLAHRKGQTYPANTRAIVAGELGVLQRSGVNIDAYIKEFHHYFPPVDPQKVDPTQKIISRTICTTHKGL